MSTSGLDFCSFERVEWDFPAYFEADGWGPILRCDTHHAPASFEVYECDPGQEVGLCRPTARLVEEHTGFYGQGLIGRDAVVDQTRCRCGRPVDACGGRRDAEAIVAHLDEQRRVKEGARA